MNSGLLIGIDAGTSVIKAVVFDAEGRQVAAASRPNSYRALEGGGVVQDMRRTWIDAAQAVADLSESVDGLADRVIALAVTGQGDGTWLIDADGEPAHDGWLWLDARAGAEARALAESDGIDVIYQATGTGVNICQMRTHLRWMRRHQPELLEKAAAALHCKDWLYLRLTGVCASDPSEAVFTFGDFRTRDYSDAAIAALDLQDLSRLLPPIVDGARQSHPLTGEAARMTGLPQGLPVVLGYVDVVCSGLGAGLCDPKALPGLTVLGSTGVHLRYMPSAADVSLNEDRSGYTMLFPCNAVSQMQTNMVATINLDWFLDLGCQLLADQGIVRSRLDLLAAADSRVLEAQPGAALFHPYISSAGERGPFTEPAARASFTGLEQNAGWIELLRAVYDGIALAARDCYAAMGPIPGEIRLTGGGARSPAMRKILAAALAAPVRGVDQAEAGAAGAVMIAAVQQGLFPDTSSCSAAWLSPLLQDSVIPDPEAVPLYDTLYAGYLATRQAMPDIWKAQARMRAALPT